MIVKRRSISLLPGPVEIAPSVTKAFGSPPISHRSCEFIEEFEEARNILRSLLGGLGVAIFPGGGTLANDVIASNLKADHGSAPGLIVSNGEFGERLLKHAEGANLNYSQVRFKWGKPYSFDEISQAMSRRTAWCWAAHLETSTGMLNDIARLSELAEQKGVFSIALDCVSSIGAVHIDPHPYVRYVSGVSGKSLGSYAGAAFVFCKPMTAAADRRPKLPPSFDVQRMIDEPGPASTIGSSLVRSLARALHDNYETNETADARYRRNLEMGALLRREVQTANLRSIVDGPDAAPNIVTFVLPTPDFPTQCRNAGFRIAYESSYLRERNWGQIAIMGQVTATHLKRFFRLVGQF